MPVNYQEIQRQVKEVGRQAPLREQELQERRRQARYLLNEYANEIDFLRQRIQLALSRNSGLRCAVPVSEPLTATFSTPTSPPLEVLLAADGSQINPDRHASIEFAVINVGVIRIAPRQMETPREIIRTRLLYGDDIDRPQGMLTEEQVMLMRDLQERRVLVELATRENPPILALTDGPLELFRESMDQKDRSEFLEYVADLEKLASMQVMAAGYVDKPRANLVVRLLELTQVPENQLGQVGQIRPLHGANDVDLFAPLLKPGQRSAIFALQSSTARNFNGPVALHFFYLNVGQEERAALARVEIPAWLAGSPPELAMLHSTLVGQCLQMGKRPYPYALHRAHEIAVIGPEEKQHLETMIALELRNRQIAIDDKSNKQAAKDRMGARGRFKIL